MQEQLATALCSSSNQQHCQSQRTACIGWWIMLAQNHHAGIFPVSSWSLESSSSLKSPLLALTDAARQSWHVQHQRLLRSREWACWLHSNSNLYLQNLACSCLYHYCVIEDIMYHNRCFQLALTTAFCKLPLHIAQASAGSPVTSLVLTPSLSCTQLFIL